MTAPRIESGLRFKHIFDCPAYGLEDLGGHGILRHHTPLRTCQTTGTIGADHEFPNESLAQGRVPPTEFAGLGMPTNLRMTRWPTGESANAS